MGFGKGRNFILDPNSHVGFTQDEKIQEKLSHSRVKPPDSFLETTSFLSTAIFWDCHPNLCTRDAEMANG